MFSLFKENSFIIIIITIISISSSSSIWSILILEIHLTWIEVYKNSIYLK